METFFQIAVVLFVLYLILDIFILVDGAEYGVHLRFGERTGRIYEEGLGKKVPLIDRVEKFSTELDEIDVSTSFTTKDTLELSVKGSLQYRPDARISDDPDDMTRDPLDRRGRNTFYAMSKPIIKSGIEDALKSLLGGLGGIHDAHKFVENRQALGALVNSILRLEKPLHLHHDPATCGLEACPYPDEKIDAHKLVDFYNDHWRWIKEDINLEKIQEDEVSPFEKRYGIDIETFKLGVVSFTPETRAALEKKEQAKARKKAFDIKMAMVDDATKRGASFQEAANAADISLDPEIEKRIISVEGNTQTGILGGALDRLADKGGK